MLEQRERETVAGFVISSEHDVARLVSRLDSLVQTFEAWPDPEVRARVFELLQGIDALHRAGLLRLVDSLPPSLRDVLVQRATADPVVRMLLGMYDIVPLEREETGLAPGVSASEPAQRPAAFIPVGKIRGRSSRWVEIGEVGDLPPNSLHGISVGDDRLLVVRLDGDWRVFPNACPGSILPLDLGRLDGNELVCPWHGCRYELSTGARLDSDGPPLPSFAVRTVGNHIEVELPPHAL